MPRLSKVDPTSPVGLAIQRWNKDESTELQIVNLISSMYPDVTYASLRSLQAWKRKYYISAVPTHIPDDRVVSLVKKTQKKMGADAGYLAIQGSLRHDGMVVSEKRIAAAQRALSPRGVKRRASFAERMVVRTRYHSTHHLQSVHLDANLKMKFCGGGFTWTAAIDGKTYEIQWLEIVGSLGGSGTNAADSSTFLRIFLDTYGPLKGTGILPDQVITDKGWENKGILFAQHLLARMANWHQDEGARPPARAVYSVNGNMRIEKKWQDINMHINADFMFCVGVMKQSNLYDVENRIQNSAFYRAALPALREAATQFMDAWRCKTLKTQYMGRVTSAQMVKQFDAATLDFPVFRWPNGITEAEIMKLWKAEVSQGAAALRNAENPIPLPTGAVDPLHDATLRDIRDRAVEEGFPAKDVLISVRFPDQSDIRKGALLRDAFAAQMLTTELLCDFVATGVRDWTAFVALGGTPAEQAWRSELRRVSGV